MCDIHPRSERNKIINKIYSDLSLAETCLWIAGWSFGVFYSVYHVYLASQKYHPLLEEYELSTGWLPGRMKDVSDQEWSVFSKNAFAVFPWMCLHMVGSQYFKKFNKQGLIYFYFVLSTAFFIHVFSVSGLLYLLIQPLVMFVAHLSGSSIIVWLCALIFLVSHQFYPMYELKEMAVENADSNVDYLLSVTSCWINSRCVSFCLDHIWKDVPDNQSIMEKLIHMISFCLYVPLAIGGPLINYIDFYKGIISDYRPWNTKRLLSSLGLLTRYIFWCIFIEVTLHYFYFSAIQLDIDIVRSIDLWTLAGIGYSMGQMFHSKYVFFYGLPRVFVLADDIPAPPHPKCIGRIHLYSDMWRYFDNGLYQFMHRYIYEPIFRYNNNVAVRLGSSMVCFTFVYVWHGTHQSVLIWSVLNNLGIIAETLGREISKTQIYSKFETNYLSPRGVRRLHCFITAPLFIMSILSNFYFFMGVKVGHHFVQRALMSWPIGTPTVLFFMFCGCQTSIEVKNWELKRKLSSIKD